MTLRLPWRTYLSVLALLVLVRAGLPVWVEDFVDRQLDGIPDFEAEVGDLDLNLWRGAYEIEQVRLFREGRSRRLGPFFSAARVDLSIEWGALLRGALVNTTALHRPVLQIEVNDSEGESQAKVEASWRERFQALFPLRVDRFTIHDGQVHYVNRRGDVPIDLWVEDLYVEARNLTNIRDSQRTLSAEVEAAGRPLGTSELELLVVFDPLVEVPVLELDMELRKVPLTELNDLLQSFAGVDAESGTLGVYCELAAAEGRFEGYVKTVVEEAQLLSLEEVSGPGDALELLWEGLVGAAAEVLENQPYDRLATRVPLTGELDAIQADVWGLVASLVGNAFLEALRPVIDHSANLEDLLGEASS